VILQPKHPAGRRRAEAVLWRAAKAESRMIFGSGGILPPDGR
jgi:hypothetical protein